MWTKLLTGISLLSASLAYSEQLIWDGVTGFQVLPETCSFTTIWEKLGDYYPQGQIEGVYFYALNKDKLNERVQAYLQTDEQKTQFANWLAQYKVSDLRMRAKEVRFNQWGGQGADEWVMFCAKPENVIYLLNRNLWSE